ncbi:Trafficking protein particle complex subunit 13 [Gracilaria domingensis]|nr:Trafficking protein particle complex subunit 13 [Gracilaria domingensis]
MMQTASQKRIPLYENPKPHVLRSRKTINNVVSITLAELGVHVLVCTASYRDNGQTRSLRQFFRFNVLPPLEPTVSVAPLYRRLDAVHIASPPVTSSNFLHYLVDLRLLNAIPMPLYTVKAVFEPKTPYCVRPLKRDDEQRLQTLDYMLKHGRRAIIGPGDITTFLFHVYRKLPTQTSSSLWDGSEVQVLKHDSVPEDSVKQMGKITIYWRSAAGENAQMKQDVVLTDVQDKQPDIEVGVCAVPQDIHVHQPFVVRCAARNNTEVEKRLYLQIRRDLVGDVVPVGVSGVSLGEVAPGRIVRCGITMIALVRGQHTLTGIRVVDIDSKVSYKAEAPSITVL